MFRVKIQIKGAIYNIGEKTVCDEIEYKVTFKRHYESVIDIKGVGICQRAITTCLIFEGDFPYPVGAAEAVCNPVDNFDKNIGRKLALKYALQDVGFSKEKRELFWKAYFETRGKVN